MKILLLGGTRDALDIANALIKINHDVTYSIAGIVRQPKIDCRILSGGFTHQTLSTGVKSFANGEEGLAWHLAQERYDLVIDATHPYAVQISQHAVTAAQQTNALLWRYLRAPWPRPLNANWHEFDSLDTIIEKLKPFKKPFFTMGREVFNKVDSRLPTQQWLVRSAGFESKDQANIIAIDSIGPFKFEDELSLFKTYGVDVLISKNSGGQAVAEKLDVASQLNIPVFMLMRPTKPYVEHCFSTLNTLLEQINIQFPH